MVRALLRMVGGRMINGVSGRWYVPATGVDNGVRRWYVPAVFMVDGTCLLRGMDNAVLDRRWYNTVLVVDANPGMDNAAVLVIDGTCTAIQLFGWTTLC